MPNQKLIAFNWKENPATARDAVRLFRAVVRGLSGAPKGSAVVVFPPFLYLTELVRAARARRSSPSPLTLGAQDVFWENEGAYTGEIGPAMLRGIGKMVQWTIVGHSERRRSLGETDEMISKKLAASRAAGLRVVLCVGEPAEVRRKGSAAARRYVKDQLKKDLRGRDRRLFRHGDLVVAYEPIWAIGTGRHCSPEEAVAMSRFIKQEVPDAPVLYGGSVDGDTAESYLWYNEIDGVLVGAAGLRPKEVKKIITGNFHHG